MTRFESSVNSEGIETRSLPSSYTFAFESSVNSEGIETLQMYLDKDYLFESSVNSEGIETKVRKPPEQLSLRAV